MLLAQRVLVMPEPSPRRPRPAVVVPIRVTPYAPGIEGKYLYRLRQLEADLGRDPGEYAIRARLGLLTLRLATHTPDRERAVRRYEAARRRFEQAARLARTRREYDWALTHREACSEQVPLSDALDGYLRPDPLATTPPPSLDLAAQLRLRAQFLEMRVLEQPRNARLLCRLGLTYVRLSQALDGRGRREEASAASPEWTPRACHERAAECLEGSLRRARSHEIRADVFLALAELHRAAGNSSSCLAALRSALRLRPNHWPAQLHAAALLSRMGRVPEASEHRARAARWRTPEWL
jgi:tetratricopeptide (TPR) repeat protein